MNTEADPFFLHLIMYKSQLSSEGIQQADVNWHEE